MAASTHSARPETNRICNLVPSRDTEKDWRHEHALAAGAIAAPAEALVSVDATWDNATATHGKLDTFQPGTVRGGHAPCVVGYTADNRFIIRNSWGTTWGDQGLAYASEAYVNAAFFDESYGVTL